MSALQVTQTKFEVAPDGRMLRAMVMIDRAESLRPEVLAGIARTLERVNAMEHVTNRDERFELEESTGNVFIVREIPLSEVNFNDMQFQLRNLQRRAFRWSMLRIGGLWRLAEAWAARAAGAMVGGPIDDPDCREDEASIDLAANAA